MSGYFSSLTTSSAISNLSTRFTSLRRAISSDEVDDPENEDLSHISNTLRAYYTEKGRPLPPWLPPDRKTPTATPPAIATQGSLQGYGGQAGTQSQPPPSRGGGLGDLWGDSPSQHQPSQTSSLRLVRSANQGQQPPSTASGGGSSLKPPSANAPHRPSSSGARNAPPFDRTHSSNAVLETQSGRPLPSQRAGSYQSSQAAAQQGRQGPDRGPSGTSASAQDRLRARLHGGPRGPR